MRATVTLVRLWEGALESVPAILTNQHAASSGTHVLVTALGYIVLGPGDVDGVVLTGDPIAQDAAKAAGWRVAGAFTEARQILRGTLA